MPTEREEDRLAHGTVVSLKFFETPRGFCFKAERR